jgi:catechol 2,3-dioxygenase-like lactoylglutathione lyase family enzyme
MVLIDDSATATGGRMGGGQVVENRSGPDLFHVGLVVADMESAMAALGAALGARWGKPEHRSAIRDTPTGPQRYDSVFAFSLDGPPYWELIGRLEGTPWSRVGFHHAGLWCDDFDTAAERRVAAGWQWESGKYFQGPDGVRYELVPRGPYEPRIARYLAGGPFFENDA